MLKLTIYEPGKGTRVVEHLDDISELIEKSDAIVWLDGLDPTREEIDFLADEFGFHPLAIDDYYTPHERPKVDEYSGYYFVVAEAPEYQPRTYEVTARELVLFVGRNYVVTLHRRPMDMLSRVEQAWREGAAAPVDGIGMLLYQILDGLVDSYFPVLDQIDDQLDELEDEVLRSPQQSTVEHVFRLKRALLLLRRTATPLRDVLNTLSRRDQPLLPEHSITYLRDVYDHTLRIVDTIDTFRDILTGALDAYLTVISNQLNSIMKTLTVGAIVLATNTVVAGIYGMNFRYMPEIHWRYGYPFALGLMALLTAGLFYYFRRIKWI